MTQHILCAVDLTHLEDARAILREANRLAGFYGAKMSVVTVIPDYGSSWVGTYFKEGSLKQASKVAAANLHEITEDALDRPGETQHIIEIGNSYEKILEAAEMVEADLIVVGAHKPDLADRMAGPNSVRVVRHAQTSVLVLRV